jgi:hypothetical protein
MYQENYLYVTVPMVLSSRSSLSHGAVVKDPELTHLEVGGQYSTVVQFRIFIQLDQTPRLCLLSRQIESCACAIQLRFDCT